MKRGAELRLGPKHSKRAVRLTDGGGKTAVFETIAAAAEFLGVTPPAVRQAIYTGCRCRGCRAEYA